MRRTWRDVVLALLAIQFCVIGVWAVAAPRSFYDSFPGGGRVWVAVDGPFNEHLVRDVGALFLVIAVVCGYAFVSRSCAAVRSAGLAVVVFSLPHTIYHVAHVDLLPAVDGILNVVSLLVGLALGMALVVSPSGSTDEQVDGAAAPGG